MTITLAALTVVQLFTGVEIAQQAECDPHYSGACIPIYGTAEDDVDCSEIDDKNFTVVTIGEDPHRLDGDKDGIACESRR